VTETQGYPNQRTPNSSELLLYEAKQSVKNHENAFYADERASTGIKRHVV
jgi:hypothetical protein